MKEMEKTMETLATSLTTLAVTTAKLSVLVHEGLTETHTQIEALLAGCNQLLEATQEHRRRLDEGGA
jgi:hypothetical protein